MALDLTGIQNVEFYSGHYLDAVLESDLKSVFSRWTEAEKESGTKPPWKALAGLSDRWYRAAEAASDSKDLSERWQIAREFHADLLPALGYPYSPEMEPLDGSDAIPVLASLHKDGQPFLWIVDSPWPIEDDEDPLSAYPLIEQIPASVEGVTVPQSTWRELFDDRIFRLNQAPRWILYLCGTEALVVERHKWGQGKLLRFDLGELLGRKQTQALRATAGLLHRDILAPETGLCLHDTLDENSHKHAFAVSSDLKHGVRRSVELLANEAVWYRREVQKKGVFNEEELACNLTQESLTWLYRMLFLFYVEARGGELGIVPMKSDAYRMGYSLESLRDLELVALTTADSRDGYYIHESLKALFEIVNQGFPAIAEGAPELELGDTMHHSMQVDALNSPLFDDNRLEVLKAVKFRNHVLQEILQLLSLSAEKKRKSRGRISYAQLGINQLGAVYEGLLSYTGFFAHEHLYEVASEKDNKGLSGKAAAEREALKTYFVPESRIDEYKDTEIVRDEDSKKIVHSKGTFIFRLAGRNREKSASYYTPEVLTKCLVKYALKELLWEEGDDDRKPSRKQTADEILALTICEPAMGSSAFLIEAVDQLADAYLHARQEELNDTIPPEVYQREKRRVKARLATNNCYGVDLNPTAVELAKVSLWLATLHEDGKCPWFGLRLATGNSLVGARREVFKTVDVIRPNKKDDPNWLGLVPEPVSLHHGEDGPPVDEHWTAPPRPKGTIYHFLLPAEGMAAFDKDKVIKQLAPESVKRIKEWRKEFCKPFNKKDAERLEQISDAVDRLFAQVVRERVLATQETSDRIPVWGEPTDPERGTQQAELLVRDQEEVAASLEDGSSAYRRLKLAMDAWCALWFWPIEEAELLPDRATWLAQMELIVKGQVTHEEVWQQQGLFAELSPVDQREPATNETQAVYGATLQEASVERLKRLRALSDAFRERRADYFEECGLADVDAVLAGSESLRAVQRLSYRLAFHHWDLRFAELFASRGGFDLVLGNPPWVRLEFDESGLFSDFDALLAIRRVRASDITRTASTLASEDEEARYAYFSELEGMVGAQCFLKAMSNYPHLRGTATNIYKCFISRTWGLGSETGVTALLHPEGVYDDPKGGALRQQLYPRLALHFHIRNALKLFPDVHDLVMFSLNISHARPSRSVSFESIANLVHPSTIDASFAHDGIGRLPSIKGSDGEWDIRGHSKRIVRVNQETLQLFASLFNEEGTPELEARFPVIHGDELLAVLESIQANGMNLGRTDVERFYISEHLNENRRQTDGTIRRGTDFPPRPRDMIYQGPHFYVGLPLYKTPRERCQHNQDYQMIDLASIAEDFLPRTNYTVSCSDSDYLERTPKWDGVAVTEFYRHIHRQMVSPTGERTLVATIIPPAFGHVHSVYGIAFRNSWDLLRFSSMSLSLPVDFLVKTIGKGSVGKADSDLLPISTESNLQLVCRALRMQVVSAYYSDLWETAFRPEFASDKWTTEDQRLIGFSALSRRWTGRVVLRSQLERRQAELEIDVLSAIELGLSLDQLNTVYRIQFPVLREYEEERMYDQNGRLIPLSATAAGEASVNFRSLATELKCQTGFDVHAEYHPDGSNTQELRRQKIRLGKKEADVLGVCERCTMADLLAETEVRWSDEDHPEGRPVRLVGLRYTDPGLEPRMERVYPTPWTRCDREADYRQAWAEFERRLGKKMPEGTPL